MHTDRRLCKLPPFWAFHAHQKRQEAMLLVLRWVSGLIPLERKFLQFWRLRFFFFFLKMDSMVLLFSVMTLFWIFWKLVEMSSRRQQWRTFFFILLVFSRHIMRNFWSHVANEPFFFFFFWRWSVSCWLKMVRSYHESQKKRSSMINNPTCALNVKVIEIQASVGESSFASGRVCSELSTLWELKLRETCNIYTNGVSTTTMWSSSELQSNLQSGLIAGGKGFDGRKTSSILHRRESHDWSSTRKYHSVTKPRRVPNKVKRKVYQDAVHWIISDALKRKDWHCGKLANELPNPRCVTCFSRGWRRRSNASDWKSGASSQESSTQRRVGTRGWRAIIQRIFFFSQEPKEWFMFSKRGMLRAVHNRSPKSSASHFYVVSRLVRYVGIKLVPQAQQTRPSGQYFRPYEPLTVLDFVFRREHVTVLASEKTGPSARTAEGRTVSEWNQRATKPQFSSGSNSG